MKKHSSNKVDFLNDLLNQKFITKSIMNLLFSKLKERRKNLIIDSRYVNNIENIFIALPFVTNIGDEYYNKDNLLSYLDMASNNEGKLSIVDEKAYKYFENFTFKEKNILNYTNNNTIVFVKNIRYVYYSILKYLYKVPLYITGVTGTNGKSSVVDFIRQIQSHLYKCGISVGTLGIIAQKKNILYDVHYKNDMKLTTPNGHYILNAINDKDKYCEYMSIELSSHGLIQKRVDMFSFKNIGFTSFGQDHLDYHLSEENYLQAKLKISNLTSIIVMPCDIKHFDMICSHMKNKIIIIYGMDQKSNADYGIKITNVKHEENSIKAIYKLYGKWKGEISIQLPLFTIIELLNCTCAALQVLFMDKTIDLSTLTNKFNKICSIFEKIKPVKSRFQLIGNSKNNGKIFLDYAHNPEAIQTVLEQLKPHCKGDLWILFGAGGNRDQKKRNEMGKIAAQYANKIVVTDDNPRYENPSIIRKQIIKGAKNIKNIDIVEIETSRKDAIKETISKLKKNDVLIVAGKGHEQYQDVMGNKFFHSDEKTIEDCLK